MSDLWEVEGGNFDIGYVNIREASSRAEIHIREALDAMWATYAPYADPDFKEVASLATLPPGSGRCISDASSWQAVRHCSLPSSGSAMVASLISACLMKVAGFGSRRLHPKQAPMVQTKCAGPSRSTKAAA